MRLVLKPGNSLSEKVKDNSHSLPLSLTIRTLTILQHSRKMRLSLIASPLSLLLAVSQVMPGFALYFHIDGVHPKCFFEELPKDTLVVGRSCRSSSLVPGRRVLFSTNAEGGRGFEY